MNLTIDTNVWLSFIETVNTDAVRNLQYWMNQEKFQLIMPEWIRTEYNKKCHKITNTAKKRNPGLFSEIEDILATIELIFSKSKFIANVLEGADEWVSSKKAPNHNSSNWDDTIILNTLIDYFEEDEKVYFIANDKHFRENEENLKLHPDIAERFIQKKITILYFRSYAHFVSEQNLRVKISNQRVNELYSWESLKLKVENMDLLSQLEEAIKYYYSELNFIPTSYLQHCYPFNIGSNAYTDYQGGTLKITNPKLYEFFQVALINRNGENPSINRKHFRNQIEIEKFEKVLRQLNENLVFRIGFENDTINIAVGPYDSFRTCQCIHCLYRCIG